MKWGKRHWYEKMVRNWGVGGGGLAGTKVGSGEWYEKGGIGTFLFGKRTNAKSSNGAGLRDENISNI